MSDNGNNNNQPLTVGDIVWAIVLAGIILCFL